MKTIDKIANRINKRKTNKELINEIFKEELPDVLYQKLKILLDNCKENFKNNIDNKIEKIMNHRKECLFTKNQAYLLPNIKNYCRECALGSIKNLEDLKNEMN